MWRSTSFRTSRWRRLRRRARASCWRPHRGPQWKKAPPGFRAITERPQAMMQRLDTKQLPQLTADLEKTLTSANKLVLSLDSGYGDNTKFNRDLDRLMAQTTDAVRSMRALADLLARHPEALLKGRPEGPLE